MSQLFLTSSVHAVAHDITTKVDLSKGNKLVFINTAAETESGDMQWLADDRKALVDAGWDVSDYTITGKTADQIKQDLEHFDYFYHSGGNTYHLLEQSQKSGYIGLIQDWVRNQGKVYMGTSAGSIIAGPYLPEYLLELEDMEEHRMQDVTGYGFVNFIVLPHWGSSSFKERYLSQRMENIYREDVAPLALLNDSQYIHVSNDSSTFHQGT